MSNSSSITEFLLLAFADTREMQLLHFVLFLGIYLAALLGNSLILTAVACDHRLHTPMYFFLLNLALIDLGCISTTVPKAMANSLWDTRAISYAGCAAQVFLTVFLFSAEYSLLTVMSYDRYVAICKPLHYGTLLGSRACAQMAAAAWGSGVLSAVLHTASTFSLPFCQGNAMNQFFCEIPQILKLSCPQTFLSEVSVLMGNIFIDFGCFVFIVLSYVQIIRAVLRMPSEKGRHKAFSMCLPHLAVVSLFLSTVMFTYLKPPSISFPFLDLVVAVLYSVVPPAVNPFIYSMRNQELKVALNKVISLRVFTDGKLLICLHKCLHAQRNKMSNSSSITEFLLLPFADTRELQLLHFALFLGIYLAALLGNGLILTTIACDHRLHTPMYFFLLNLALLDLGFISTTLPKAMANSLWDTRSICYAGCVAQVFFFFCLFLAEYSILTIMSYDRYVAICKPLHYGNLLGSRACAQMAAAAWGSGVLYALLHTANSFSLPLCQGNALDQFFCEIPSILKLSCTDSYLREVWLLLAGFSLAFVCFVFIILSYVQIFRAVLRMPSEQGRHKAFSTCLPHLFVVSLFLSTGFFAYLKPPSISSPSLDLVVAVLYSVLPPVFNPLIYSMRNEELKRAIRKVITWIFLKMDTFFTFLHK
nr:olfactory receptor 5T3-like [Anas platyrhynchos]